MFWQMSLHPEQADDHPSTHSIMSYSLSYRCISQYQEMIEVPDQSFVAFNLPPQNSQPQSPACKVFPFHCWTCLKTLMMWYFVVAHFGCNMWGWMAFFPGRDQLLEALIYHGVKVVTLLSFQYDGHDLLVSGNDLAFRRLHTSGQFSLFTECLISLYKC